MNHFAFQFAAVFTATLLALPPGWCCGYQQAEAAETVQATSNCCRYAPSQPQPDDEVPSTKCCHLETALTTVAVHFPDSFFLLASDAVQPGKPALDSARETRLVGSFFDTGPKLHVLQCVWRC